MHGHKKVKDLNEKTFKTSKWDSTLNILNISRPVMAAARQFSQEGRGTCDLSEVLPLIEKYALLTSQVFRMVTHQWRIYRVTRLVGGHKNPADYWQKHDDDMPAGKDLLGSNRLKVMLKRQS
jgi:hypothetical protein